MPDRITSIRIKGMRSLEDVSLLNLSGLTVLIGDNGTGKSTLLEAFSLLRDSARPDFREIVDSSHGGLEALLRQGTKSLTIEAIIKGENQKLLQHGLYLGYGSAPSDVLQSLEKELLRALENIQIGTMGQYNLDLWGDKSLVVVDDPEIHLDSGHVVEATWRLEELAERCPVIIATHSHHLLDALYTPAKSVVLCSLDRNRATYLRRPNKSLEDWLKDYRGIGAIIDEGYEAHIFEPDDV